MSSLIHFLNGAVGRLLRVAVGAALVWYGLSVFGGAAGVILALVGLVPIGMGIWGRCLIEFVTPHSARTV